MADFGAGINVGYHIGLFLKYRRDKGFKRSLRVLASRNAALNDLQGEFPRYTFTFRNEKTPNTV
jgi:hypothetical protein